MFQTNGYINTWHKFSPYKVIFEMNILFILVNELSSNDKFPAISLVSNVSTVWEIDFFLKYFNASVKCFTLTKIQILDRNPHLIKEYFEWIFYFF